MSPLTTTLIAFDRLLAHYGPEAKEERDLLRGTVSRVLDQMWPKDAASSSGAEPRVAGAGGEALYDKIQALAPSNDVQRALKEQASSLALGLGQTRWLMYEQGVTSVSIPLLIVLVLWLTLIFVSFGMFAPLNGTVVASLCVAALSGSGAIFLILEMYAPYAGLIQISSAPLRAALAHLGQ